MFGSARGSRAEREENVLRYIVHRINEGAHLHEVLQEPYVRRNCTHDEIDEIVRNPELVHAFREHPEQVLESGELAPPTSRKR